MTTRVKRGGLAPKRKGDAFEAEVCAEQRRIGRWCERIRQGQGEIVDLVAVEDEGYGFSKVYFIQCRLRGAMTSAEKEQLAGEARMVGAIPLLAWKADGQIQYRVL